jgi:hypothetical protein
MNNGINELQNQIPVIKRARDYHLYDFNGKRFLDMSLDGGRAVLGHKAGKIVRDMKNGLEKGLSAGFPTVYQHRLLTQVQRVYPGVCAVSVVFSGEELNLPVLRPFSGEGIPSGPFELVLPMTGSGCIKVLCAGSEAAGSLPPDVAVPGYLLAGLCRSAAELLSFDEDEAQKRWSFFDSPLWRRSGPWLYPLVKEDIYSALFKTFLEKGIIISPDFWTPSCAPALFTKGEIKPIKEIEGEFC